MFRHWLTTFGLVFLATSFFLTPQPVSASRPVRKFTLSQANKALPLVKRIVADIVKAHEEIYTALAKRDAAASEDRMREHIQAYTKYAEKKFPEVLDQTITWDRLLG